MSRIVVTFITNTDKKCSDFVKEAVKQSKVYKYSHTRMILTRLRAVKNAIEELPEEEQIKQMRNAIITERNIASYAADQYAELNQDAIFDDMTEIVEALDKLLTEVE